MRLLSPVLLLIMSLILKQLKHFWSISVSSGRCCEVLRGDASVRLDAYEPQELSLPHKMRGCHGMLQCINTVTIRALRRPVSKEVWDNNSACRMSKFPGFHKTKDPGRISKRLFARYGMCGIKYRNM
jgi:hypothetical protein